MSEEKHPVDVHVGQRVRDLRRARGHSQTELAVALGISFQQVQKYERGANRISASKLFEAGAFLGAHIAYFFEGLPGSFDTDKTADPLLQTVAVSADLRRVVELVTAVPKGAERSRLLRVIEAAAAPLR